MESEQLRVQCREKTDEELVRAVTVDKSQFSEAFQESAGHEMFRRGFSLSDYVNRVRVRHNNEDKDESTLLESLDLIPPQLAVWEAWFFTNVLDQTLFFQKEVLWTSVHFIAQDEAPESYFIESDFEVKDIVSRFLQLEDWRDGLENEVHLETWPILVDSNSVSYIRLVSGKLADQEIPSTVKSQGYRNCACGGGHLKILVPKASERDARKVLKELKKETDHLYKEALDMDDSTDTARALSVYARLAVLAPDDALVHFNYGTLLYEQMLYLEAAESFTSSAMADLGNLANLENNIEYLRAISDERPDDTDILHTLAGLLVQKKAQPREIADCFEKILNLNPLDAIAHWSLGYHYYQFEGADDRVRMHFEKYLELMPDAEDRAQVESILFAL